MTAINQKEYLKKYLAIGRTPGEKKKKKKKEKVVGNRLKIIDDDVDVLISREIEDDIAAANEYAPQIVAVIDERPHSLQVDEKTNSSLWQPLGEPSRIEIDPQTLKLNSFKLGKQDTHKSTSTVTKESGTEVYNKSTSRNKKSNREDYTVPKRNTDDYSPPSKSIGEDSSVSSDKDNDYSPPRRKNKGGDSSPSRKRSEEDSSPIRRNKEDNSPPRQRKDEYSRIEEDDHSPPRKKHRNESKRREREFSPINRSKSDLSPKISTVKSEDIDLSPSRKSKRKRDGKKSRWSPEKSPDSLSGDKMKKTLDGKRAGLQNAKDLSKESTYLRKKEDEIFNKMSSNISGRNAATVVRGKKVKDLEEEAARAKREQQMKEKYDRWGKGLKQVEDRDKKIEEQLHEMSKPLARYADDEDLEKYLKEQEREGDPMLAYIRKKKKKEQVAAGIPEKPMYMGEFMPNRFGIRPGYRWDGVDRSSGYEKKWFQVQNEKKASREEAFKWSTEDM